MLKRLKSLVSRPIEREICRALPLGSGDTLLLGALGGIVSHQRLSPSIFKEGELFLIKSALYLSGVRLAPSAYEGIGEIYKEQIGVYQFDPNQGKGDQRLLPAELALPNSFHVPVIVDERSPFTLSREHGTLYLYVNALRLMPVEYERRPAFYAQRTSDGVEMYRIAQHRLGDELMVTFNTFCSFSRGGKQCRFCSLTGHQPLHRGVRSYFIQTPKQIAEVAGAAYAEGMCGEMELTGGVLPDRAEIDFCLSVGRAVRERLGVETIPGGHVVIAAPTDLSQIEDLKRAGWEAVFFNMEVWDRHLFAGLCPGKEELIGWERWLAALEHAVGVFGRGRVFTVLIAGLEPMQSYLEGVTYLAEKGIRAVPIPWTPMPGSLLEGHNTPSAAWHLQLAVKTLDIWEQHGWPAEQIAGRGWMHYNDLATMRVILRDLRQRDPDYPVEKDLRYQLAVAGKMPPRS